MGLFSQLSKQRHLLEMASNASWLGIERVFRLGIGFFVAIAVAKYFGPEGYSPFAYALAIVVIFRSIAGMGLRSVFVRTYVRDPDKRLELQGSAALMILVAGVFSYVLAVGTAYFLGTDEKEVILLVAVLAGQLLLYPSETINYLFEAKVFSKPAVIARLLAYLAGVVAKVLLIYWEGTIVHLALIYLLEFSLVALFYLLVGLKYDFSFRDWKPRKAMMRELFQESKFLILAAVMVTIYMQIDKIMIYEYVGERENGLYSFAVLIAEACYFIPVIVQQSAFPNLVASEKRDTKEFNNKITKLVWP